MNLQLRYEIGGVRIGLFGRHPEEFTSPGLFPTFCTAGEDFDFEYEVKVSRPLEKPRSSPEYVREYGWRLYREENQYIYQVRNHEHQIDLFWRVTSDYRSGTLYSFNSNVNPGSIVFPLSYPLGELMMVNLLSQGYGLMMHACAVMVHGEGILFAGVGSAGKTTTANLWEKVVGAKVLNDDHTIIRKVDGQLRVYGTPWPGANGSALSIDAPLKAIFLIRHGPRNEAIPVTLGNAVFQLMNRAFAPFWNKEATYYTLGFLEEICQDVPVYDFPFVPDVSAVDYVQDICLK